MAKQYISILVYLTVLSTAWSRQVQVLDGNWDFFKGAMASADAVNTADAEWQTVTVPHTWNVEDCFQGKPYYRGPGWYRYTLTVPSDKKGQRVYVHFGAASLVADVYLNTKHIGHHRGGFAAFCYEMTPHVEWGKENVLTVQVNNEWIAGVPPLGGDFNVFGGLYRPVKLMYTDPVCITPTDYAGPGLYLSPANVSAAGADLEAKVKLSNGGGKACEATTRITVLDAENNPVATKSGSVTVPGLGTQTQAISLEIENPHLWDGLRDPYLYTVRAEVLVNDKVVDSLTQPLGLRSYHVDPEKGFFLNGRSYPLRGVCRHQDRHGKGWALSRADQDEDMALIREIGANCVRLAHYQYDEYVYELCDRAGLVVWTEVPLVNYAYNTDGYRENAKQQLIELIRQNMNHPSVCFWGLFNELGHNDPSLTDGRARCDDPRPLLEELQAIAKREDPTRLTTAASNGAIRKFENAKSIADLEAWNTYPGWYGGGPEKMGPQLDAYNKGNQYKGIGVSEYGAGGSINHHEQGVSQAPKPSGPWHPEEWQAIVHEVNYAAIEKRPFVWGTFIWNLCDFASFWRDEGDRIGINDKGLVTYDRKVKKDAFYYYKAAWSDEPVVYIASRRHTPRQDAVTAVKVYTNGGQAELKVNGKSLGIRRPENRICRWEQVELAEGDNHVEVVSTREGKEYNDACIWRLETPAAAAKADEEAAPLRNDRLEWFQDQRYGMFIHWGPSVIHGGKYSSSELSWSRGGNPPDDWCSGGPIPEAVYDDSFRAFDPVEYDPERWVQLAKDAGMRYMVMTARHHDGFSMFDTKQSDFKITHPEGAYRKRIAQENPDLTDEQINRKADILRQYADAIHAGGMGLGIYYSEPDWLREDYRIALTGKNHAGQEVSAQDRQAAQKSYQDFMHGQLEELTTQYGRVDILWFDAIKPSQVDEHGWPALWIRRDTWDMIRRNQPGILINDRHDFEPDYRTPEGSDAHYIPGVVQESCQHLGRQWAWWPDDRVPSLEWVIDRLVINASRNSNILMNLGPSPEGMFDPKQAALIRQAGQWLDKHGEAFYGTRGGPVINNEKDPGFVTMHKDSRIYIHVLHPDLAGQEICLPGVSVKKAYLSDHSDQSLRFRHDQANAYVTLPPMIDQINEIIVLEGDF